jgi:ABC-type multidrug transport system fused ATPase/permease subunit
MFLVFYLQGGVFLPSKIFVSIQLIQLIGGPFTALPAAASEILQVLASARRIQRFLLSPDLPKDASDIETCAAPEKGQPCIHLQACDFRHPVSTAETADSSALGAVPSDREPAGLSNVNLSVRQGDFVAIVGQVGAGKSTLLMSILGEVAKTAGKRSLRGSRALATQVPFVMNETVRSNILMGKKYDQTHYDKVRRAQ